jgi:UDP-N-acetylmuramate-alanine ligase
MSIDMLARYRPTRQNLCLKRVFALCYKGMHIYFSGIGGVGIGPLALIAKQAGYEVSGSDLQDGQYVKYLREQGISDINIGQGRNQISALNARKPIDWFVYSSALPKTNPDHPELLFCKENNIKTSKRDELLNKKPKANCYCRYAWQDHDYRNGCMDV